MATCTPPNRRKGFFGFYLYLRSDHFSARTCQQNRFGGMDHKKFASIGYIHRDKLLCLYRTNSLCAISGQRRAGSITDSRVWTCSEWIDLTRREWILLPPSSCFCHRDLGCLRLERSIWTPLWEECSASIGMIVLGLLDS